MKSITYILNTYNMNSLKFILHNIIEELLYIVNLEFFLAIFNDIKKDN